MTTPDPTATTKTTPTDDSLRPHSFDGIQEYDKRLPRWWLLTLYGAMAYAVLYWAYYHAYHIGLSPVRVLENEMAENSALVAQKSGLIDDNTIWGMSSTPQIVSAGKITFETTCAACHKPDLTGLIGPNLVDHEWIHGEKPMDAIKTITEGSLLKGMPAWGPLLGKQKINEVAAYIYSHHKQGEDAIAVPGWTPPPGVAPTPAPAQ